MEIGGIGRGLHRRVEQPDALSGAVLDEEDHPEARQRLRVPAVDLDRLLERLLRLRVVAGQGVGEAEGGEGRIVARLRVERLPEHREPLVPPAVLDQHQAEHPSDLRGGGGELQRPLVGPYRPGHVAGHQGEPADRPELLGLQRPGPDRLPDLAEHPRVVAPVAEQEGELVARGGVAGIERQRLPELLLRERIAGRPTAPARRGNASRRRRRAPRRGRAGAGVEAAAAISAAASRRLPASRSFRAEAQRAPASSGPGRPLPGGAPRRRSTPRRAGGPNAGARCAGASGAPRRRRGGGRPRDSAMACTGQTSTHAPQSVHLAGSIR